jgi:phage shock protein B
MAGVAEAAVVLSLAVVAPIALITNFILKLRQNRGLSVDDERMLSDLWQSAKRMEDRIRSLERILDSEQTSQAARSAVDNQYNWRNKL